MNDQPHQIEIKIQALEDKISLELNKKEEMNTCIYDMRSKIARHNEKLQIYSEEIKYYEELQRNINNNNNMMTLENENLLKSKTTEDNVDHDNAEDEMKIHKILNEILKEINEDNPLAKVKEEKKEEAMIKFYTVCVLFIEFDSDNSNTKKYQTFRISSYATINDLQEICQNFWDIKMTENPHFHFSDEQTVFRLGSDKKQDTIEKLLKENNNSKKTLFVLSFNEKLRIDDVIDQNQDVKMPKVVKPQSEAIKSIEVEKFLRKFVGLKTRMYEKLELLKENERSENTTKTIKKKINHKSTIFKALNIVFFFLFFIFTLNSLFAIKPTEKSFYRQKAFEKQFNTNYSYSTISDIKDIITNMLSPLFKETNNSLLEDNSNILINSIKIAFYKTAKKECKLVKNKICYYDKYSTGTAEQEKGSNYLTNAQYKNDKEFFPDDNSKNVEKIYTILDKNGKNILENDEKYENLLNYLNFLFNLGMRKDIKKNKIFVGRFGKYKGQSNLDLYISSPFINLNVFELLNNIIISSKNDFDIISVRGITINFILYNTQSRFFFEIASIIEISSYGGVLSPILTIRPFLFNVYQQENNGKLLLILDIFRIILIIIMMFSSIMNLIRENKENEENERKSISLNKILLNPKIIINLGILIIYSICISLKLNLLQGEIPQMEGTGEYLILAQNELSQVVDAYELTILLEAIIILLSFCQILLILNYSNRLNIFVDYIVLSFTKIGLFFVIIIFMIVSYSIFANNLWGEHHDEYKYFEYSFVYSILFSIGHFQDKIFKNENGFWNVVYTLMFFVVIIYFSHSALSGFFLETYRMNSIEKGHSYDQRILNLKDDNEDKKKKKKKVNISATNIN